MANEIKVDIHHAVTDLLKQGARDLHLVLIQHDKETDPFDTTLVVRGTSPTGASLQSTACPRPCTIGTALKNR